MIPHCHDVHLTFVLTIDDLRPKNIVCLKSVSFVKRSYIVKTVVCPSLRFTTFC